jgi:hypothetical protein
MKSVFSSSSSNRTFYTIYCIIFFPGNSHMPREHNISSANILLVWTIGCVYWTKSKATCCQYKNQPNMHNMYTALERSLSACLYLHVSFYPGVVNFGRWVFPHSTGKIQTNRKKPPQRIKRWPLPPETGTHFTHLAGFLWTTCRLSFCPLSTFTGLNTSRNIWIHFEICPPVPLPPPEICPPLPSCNPSTGHIASVSGWKISRMCLFKLGPRVEA